MIKKLMVIVLAMAACATAKSEQMKAWASGPLVWNDFQGTPVVDNGPAYLAADIVLVSGQNSSGFTEVRSQAVMYPALSYAPAEERTPDRLRYFQTRFNLAELLALQLQEEITSTMEPAELEAKLAHYRTLYRAQIRSLDDDTDSGVNLVRLQQDDDTLMRRIEELLEPESSNLVPSSVRFGLFAGTGFVATVGDLSEYFNTAWDFSFGVIFDWRRIGLEASVTFAYPTVKDPELTQSEYAGGNYYANVKNANYMAIGITGGYDMVDSKSFLIRPYVGGMWTSYRWTARPLDLTQPMEETVMFDGPQQRMSLTNFNVTFGINFEWHFHTALTNFPVFGKSCQQYVSSLRLTPYAVHSVYNNASTPFGGWQIGLTVAYSGVGRAMGVR